MGGGVVRCSQHREWIALSHLPLGVKGDALSTRGLGLELDTHQVSQVWRRIADKLAAEGVRTLVSMPEEAILAVMW
jgi:hypothetical protein